LVNDLLDVRGKACPIPVLLTKRKLESMKEGEVLEVLGDYPQTRENIIKMVKRTQNMVLDVEKGKGSFKITIRKKSPSRDDENLDEMDASCPSSN
jgi:tRNA 2-thiouridine synthesizing protein A